MLMCHLPNLEKYFYIMKLIKNFTANIQKFENQTFKSSSNITIKYKSIWTNALYVLKMINPIASQ